MAPNSTFSLCVWICVFIFHSKTSLLQQERDNEQLQLYKELHWKVKINWHF